MSNYRDVCLDPLKHALNWLGAFLVMGALVIVCAVPWQKAREQTPEFHTYYYQALQAVTPEQFARSLRQLDAALEKTGMVRGDTVPTFLPSGPHNDMGFKREQYLALVQRAEGLTSLAGVKPSSTEVSTGLQDMRVALQSVSLSVYDFWLWQQGGAWLQFWYPLILLGTAITILVISDCLPNSIERRVKNRPDPKQSVRA